jgi:hypothetical protein
MRIAYLTTDEVNEAVALEMAQACGVALYPLAPKDGPPDKGYDAVLCDWDFWPVDRRRELLAGRDGHPYLPLAVHGYNLDEGQAEGLRRRGAAVHKNLRPEVFLELFESATSAQLAGPSVASPEETESVISPA